MSDTLPDRRINAYRDDLAAVYLKGQIKVPNYSNGEKRQLVAGAAQLRKAPRLDAPLETEFLYGETVTVYDHNEGWAWAQSDEDAYVGYLSDQALSERLTQATHRVRALRTHLYPAPDIKTPPLDLLSMNAQVCVARIEGQFAQLSDGRFAFAAHLAGIDDFAPDFVSVAQEFLGTPYLWGGRTSIGLDCSSLVQLSLQASGVGCPRDSDMQETTLGEALTDPQDQAAFARGDLLFWDGHVGIMLDETRLLHANAHHMAVAIEPASTAIARINETTGRVRSVRRGAGRR